MVHHWILGICLMAFGGLFLFYPTKYTIHYPSPLPMQFPKCQASWCPDHHAVVAPHVIALSKQLEIKTPQHHLDEILDNYFQSEKYHYIAVDVKKAKGLDILLHLCQSLWAGILSKREILLSHLILPMSRPVKQLQGHHNTVSSIGDLVSSQDTIVSVDLTTTQLNVPELQFPPQFLNKLLDFVLFDLAHLSDPLRHTIASTRAVLQSQPSLAIKITDKINQHCIMSLIKHYNVVFLYGKKKKVMTLHHKLLYKDKKSIHLSFQKYYKEFNVNIDWDMIQDYIALSASKVIGPSKHSPSFETLNADYVKMETCQ